MKNLKRSAEGEDEALKMMKQVFTERGKELDVTHDEGGMWRGHGYENKSFHLLILAIMEQEGVRGWLKFFCFGQVERERQGKLTYLYTSHPGDMA